MIREVALNLLAGWHDRRYRLAAWAERRGLGLARWARARAVAAMRAYERAAFRADLLRFGRRSRRP